MATTIKSLRFGSSLWAPRGGDSGLNRATMVLIISVSGFDTHTLIQDLAQYISDKLDWAKLYGNVVPLASVALEAVDIDSLAERVGAVLVAVDVNQPAPTYGEDSYLAEPDSATGRVLLEQIVSANRSDQDMLLDRRRDLVALLAPMSGVIP